MGGRRRRSRPPPVAAAAGVMGWRRRPLLLLVTLAGILLLMQAALVFSAEQPPPEGASVRDHLQHQSHHQESDDSAHHLEIEDHHDHGRDHVHHVAAQAAELAPSLERTGKDPQQTIETLVAGADQDGDGSFSRCSALNVLLFVTWVGGCLELTSVDCDVTQFVFWLGCICGRVFETVVLSFFILNSSRRLLI